MGKRVLIAFDKFKHSLGATDACDAVARALRAERPDWEIETAPLSDGGEGFASILTRAAGGEWRKATVAGPRGQTARAGYGLVPLPNLSAAAREKIALPITTGGRLAVVEMAAASGLDLLSPAERDPWKTSSVGTGQLLRLAVEQGDVAAVLLGVGGSATQDLGLGALHALGLRAARDPNGSSRPDPDDPGSLLPEAWPGVAGLAGSLPQDFPPVRIACDVDNPLLGPRGTVAVYAPQKGLRPEDRDALEEATARAAGWLLNKFDGTPDDLHFPGGGAAGGIAFGLKTALGARLVPGFSLLEAWLGLREKLERADLVITGEGSFDSSSLEGKGPGSLLRAALNGGKTVWVLAGKLELPPGHPLFADSRALLRRIAPPGTSVEESHRRAAEFLQQSACKLLVKTKGNPPIIGDCG